MEMERRRNGNRVPRGRKSGQSHECRCRFCPGPTARGKKRLAIRRGLGAIPQASARCSTRACKPRHGPGTTRETCDQKRTKESRRHSGDCPGTEVEQQLAELHTRDTAASVADIRWRSHRHTGFRYADWPEYRRRTICRTFVTAFASQIARPAKSPNHQSASRATSALPRKASTINQAHVARISRPGAVTEQREKGARQQQGQQQTTMPSPVAAAEDAPLAPDSGQAAHLLSSGAGNGHDSGAVQRSTLRCPPAQCDCPPCARRHGRQDASASPAP